MSNSNVQILGQRIKHYRKLNSLTQKELAAEIGVAPQFIASVEQGVKGISVDKLVELCKWFNISMSDILPLDYQRDADTQTKERLIGEIVETLSTWDTARVGLLKTMVCSRRN